MSSSYHFLIFENLEKFHPKHTLHEYNLHASTRLLSLTHFLSFSRMFSELNIHLCIDILWFPKITMTSTFIQMDTLIDLKMNVCNLLQNPQTSCNIQNTQHLTWCVFRKYMRNEHRWYLQNPQRSYNLLEHLLQRAKQVREASRDRITRDDHMVDSEQFGHLWSERGLRSIAWC